MVRFCIAFFSVPLFCISFFSSIYTMYTDDSIEKETIVMNQNQKWRFFLEKQLPAKTKDEHLAFFKNKLQRLCECIKQQESRLHQAIKTEFQVSDFLWKEMQFITKKSKEREKTQLHLPLQGVFHDERVPSYIKEIVIPLLAQKDINS